MDEEKENKDVNNKGGRADKRGGSGCLKDRRKESRNMSKQ